jgi:hypothetical protein
MRFLIFASILTLGFGAAVVTGWEPFASKRGHIPASIRQAPGGYRSFVYWRGGK